MREQQAEQVKKRSLLAVSRKATQCLASEALSSNLDPIRTHACNLAWPIQFKKIHTSGTHDKMHTESLKEESFWQTSLLTPLIGT